MPTPRHPATDWDGVWKEALRAFLGPFVRLLFPDVAALIDWDRPISFLDQELRSLHGGAGPGSRVDLLARACGSDGRARWLFLHVEVQQRRDPGFARRMYRYWSRLAERHGDRVVSVAVLADLDPRWRPTRHSAAIAGCRLEFHFPTCKLIDLESSPGFASSTDPAALVVAAHLAGLRTCRAGQEHVRLESKLGLARRLFRAGLCRGTVERLMVFLDCLIRLPEPEGVEFARRIKHAEREERMKLIGQTQIILERMARQEGLDKGLAEGHRKGQREGRLKGRREGRLEGRLEGRREGQLAGKREGQVAAARAIVVDIASARFGPISPRTRRCIESLDHVVSLRALARRAATLPDRRAFESHVASRVAA